MDQQIPVKVMPSEPPAYVDPKTKTCGKIYVRKSEGKFEQLRRSMYWLLLGLFVVLPWISYEGRQAILLDISEQRFNIFALTFWPQDLTLLAYILIVSAFALFFVTTFAGRVWCGFMCPQTTWVYLYLQIEEFFEGSANKRKKLDQKSMDKDKFLRKLGKQIAWWLVALITAMTFVAYFVPAGEVFAGFFSLELSGWVYFWIVFFAVCTYGNAAYAREIMCTVACPYSRFQSAMFDKDTLIVAYDYLRGEGRGPRSRKMSKADYQAKGLGDCVDCNLCVQVCPTGIDIRNGLQYECINCGACIDTCNDMMDKMGYERGLISFTSEHKLAGGITKVFRSKLIGYGIVMVIMLGLLSYSIVSREELEIDILRDRNSLYRETLDGLVENVYTVKLLNKSQLARDYQINFTGFNNINIIGQTNVTVAGGDVATIPMSVAVDAYDISQRVTDIRIVVTWTNEDGEQQSVSENTRFLYR